MTVPVYGPYVPRMEQFSLFDDTTPSEDLTKQHNKTALEKQLLVKEVKRLQHANKHLKSALDDVRQTAFPEPSRCKCGCGKLITHAQTGRKREFFNNACRQRLYRRKKRDDGYPHKPGKISA